MGQSPILTQDSGATMRHSGASMRPVPKFGSQTAQALARPNPQAAGWNLQWRKSDRLSSSPRVTPERAASAPRQQSPHLQLQDQRSSGLRQTTVAPRLSNIHSVNWQSPQDSSPRGETLIQPPAAEGQPSGDQNFFRDPFGDDPLPTPSLINPSPLNPIPAQGERLIPPPAESLPKKEEIENQLRAPDSDRPNMFERAPVPNADQVEPLTDQEPPTIVPPPAEARPEIETLEPPTEFELPEPQPTPSLGERLRQERPDTKENSQTLPTPREEAKTEQDENPFGDFEFDKDRNSKDRDRLNAGDDLGGNARRNDDVIERPDEPTCSEFRQRIASQTIEQVSLDISPPYRPDELDLDKYAELKEEFDEKQEIRQWRAIDGSPMASGRLRDLAYQQAIIETSHGERQALQLNRLSEGDIAYIAEQWGLPAECLLEQTAPTPRNWAMTTMTWKASNLCHTPLYFEDVNLERYGHTHGPVLEPLVQSAHFFGNVLILPYKMGVHSPHECQYPLGYYRPGNCAPWIKQPVPISAKGALTQAVTMTGLFWLIP